MKMRFLKKAQSMTEVALVIAILGLAFMGMETYIRRGMQGKIKDLSDNMLGTEQSDYASDVSGLEALNVHSNTDVGSTSRLNVSAGGVRQTISGANINATSNTHSEYVP